MVLEAKDLRLQTNKTIWKLLWDQKVLLWSVLPWFSLLQEILHILFHGDSENMCYTFFTDKNANTSSSTTEEPSGRWDLHCKLVHLWVALSLYRSASASWLHEAAASSTLWRSLETFTSSNLSGRFYFKAQKQYWLAMFHCTWSCLLSAFHYGPEDEQLCWPFQQEIAENPIDSCRLLTKIVHDWLTSLKKLHLFTSLHQLELWSLAWVIVIIIIPTDF